MKTPVILSLLFAVCAFAGCSGAPSTNTNTIDASANSTKPVDPAELAKDNAEELGLLIELPYEPMEAVYREAPEEKKLKVIVRFTSEEADRIIGEKAGENVSMSPEAWFPQELIGQSEMDTASQLLHGKRYAADEFYKPPYSVGTATRIDGTDYFIIELTAQ